MKWYWWTLIALALIGIIYFAVRASKAKTTAANSLASNFNPYNIIPINTASA